MSVTCANGHTNLDGMAFCEECGVELTTLTDRPGEVDPASAVDAAGVTETPAVAQGSSAESTPGSADTGDTMMRPRPVMPGIDRSYLAAFRRRYAERQRGGGNRSGASVGVAYSKSRAVLSPVGNFQ